MAVSVDDDFARFGGKSYAINKINTVEVRARYPNGQGGAVILALLAALCVFGWFAALNSDQGTSGGPLLFAAIFGALAYWQFQRSKVREYQLFLMTSSSEAQAFVSRDRDEVFSLREQIEGAMLRHSRAYSDR